jgi:hypothetical protein
MTARNTHYQTVCIYTKPGESPSEELDKYIRELEARGHEMLRVTAAAVGFVRDPTARYACVHCKQSLRTYMFDDQGSFFSDFMEGEQCVQRQINVLYLQKRS